jgi:hypothetical protein
LTRAGRRSRAGGAELFAPAAGAAGGPGAGRGVSGPRPPTAARARGGAGLFPPAPPLLKPPACPSYPHPPRADYGLGGQGNKTGY